MSEEIEWVWVDFVGGPLDGQSRRLERGRTTWNAPYPLSDEDRIYETRSIATYKIERHWQNKPGFHKEWFTGVLV